MNEEYEKFNNICNIFRTITFAKDISNLNGYYVNEDNEKISWKQFTEVNCKELTKCCLEHEIIVDQDKIESRLVLIEGGGSSVRTDCLIIQFYYNCTKKSFISSFI